VLVELARMLGRLAHARFDAFDLERPLVELVWSGATFPADVQRLALAQALDVAQRYASTPDLLRFVRRGIADGAADERLDALMAVELLVLDDLGAERMTAWADEQLFVLLNTRYLAERATVLTSNDRPEALPARLQSRIAEQAQLIWMPLSDYRQLRVGG
jgi:DNA replication protein DnaC